MRSLRALPLPSFERETTISACCLLYLAAFSFIVSAIDERSLDTRGNKFVQKSGAGTGHLLAHYDPDFLGIDRSIIGRAGADVEVLSNNAPGKLNIEAGKSHFWTFPKKEVDGRRSPDPPKLPTRLGECPDPPKPAVNVEPQELRKRQNEKEVFITLNTCDQPVGKEANTNGAPDQLKLYVSKSESNQKPDANKHDFAVPVDGGYANFSTTTNNNIYIGVSAPSDDDFSGDYNYEITASIDDYYAKYDSPSRQSLFIDSDNNSALLYTANTTSCNSANQTFQDWLKLSPPFSVYVHNVNNPALLGLHKSLCALKNYAQVQGDVDIAQNMTTAKGGQPKQQFYVKNLNSSSAYDAFVAIDGITGDFESSGRGNVNGGGTVFNITSFRTKSSPNCALVFDLDFCSEVAYAVPSNPTKFKELPDLRRFYDRYASSMNDNFTKSLAQIPCNTTESAQYSLAANCTTCAAAYKNWLCAVTIPRCEDFSINAPHLQPRAINQSFLNQEFGEKFPNFPATMLANMTVQEKSASLVSRNTRIDEEVGPGPYKEVLPCEDLCYNLVRNCPAALEFACPLEDHGLQFSYGKYAPTEVDGEFTCNYPGIYPSAASWARGFCVPLLIGALSTVAWISLG